MSNTRRSSGNPALRKTNRPDLVFTASVDLSRHDFRAQAVQEIKASRAQPVLQKENSTVNVISSEQPATAQDSAQEPQSFYGRQQQQKKLEQSPMPTAAPMTHVN